MPHPAPHFRFGVYAALLLLAGALTQMHADAAEQSEEAPAPPRAEARTEPGRHWLSFLIPTAFEKNPQVDFNVITEMTEAGRKARKPSSRRPAYYITQSMGFYSLGQGAPARETSPPPAQLADAMREALAHNGYLAAGDTGNSSSLVVVFYWGSFSSAGWDGEAINNEMARESANPEAPPRPTMHSETAADLLPLVLTDLTKRKELLERASLVGGVKFAAELKNVLNEEASFEDQRENEARLASFMAGSSGGGFTGSPVLGGAVAGNISAAFNSFNPFQRFRARNQRTEYLIERSFGSCYFIVASAYDVASLSTNERVLLWRTKMTVSSNGVSMTETLPRLVASAAPYFGVEMAETATIKKRIDREGTVEIGTPTVIEVMEDDAPASPPPSGEAPSNPSPAPDAQ